MVEGIMLEETMKEEAPNYLINLIPKCNQTIRTRNSHIPIFHCQTDCFNYSFFFYLLSKNGLTYMAI